MATEPAELRRQMVEAVLAEEFVARWRAALTPWWSSLLAVARHRFIPDLVWIGNDDGPPAFVPLRCAQDPDRWLRLTYGADGVVTQVDNGHPGGPGLGGSMPTSSASGPVMVTVMLAALNIHQGHRVLEVGTGTGYNAALLAHRLGTERVTSIEIDPDLGRARQKSAVGQRAGGRHGGHR